MKHIIITTRSHVYNMRYSKDVYKNIIREIAIKDNKPSRFEGEYLEAMVIIEVFDDKSIKVLGNIIEVPEDMVDYFSSLEF